MNRIVVLTTAETGTIDAANTLQETIKANWPEADVKVLVSSRVESLPKHWDVLTTEQANDTPFVISRILCEADQLALALPTALSRLVEAYEICLYIGPGRLVVRPPLRLLDAAKNLGTALVVTGSVASAHSLTPALGAIQAGPLQPDSRVVAVSAASKQFLTDWATILEETVLDADQRSVAWAGDTFINRSIARSDVGVEGEGTFLHWADYAAVEVGRATGPDAAIVACDALFDSVRALDMADDPEVAWGLLVHRVHDSRPVDPLLRLIEDSQILNNADATELPLDILKADIWRAADPYGRRWGSDSVDEFDAWLFEVNDAGCTRIADLLVKLDPELSRRFFRARFDPGELKAWVETEGRLELGFDPFDHAYRPRAAKEVEEEGLHPTLNAVAWRWNTIKSLLPGYTRRATRSLEREFLGPDPQEKRGLAPPRHVAVDRFTPLWGSSPRNLNILGPFRSESGLGQATRASLQAIRSLEIPFTHIDTTEKYPSRNSVNVGLTPATYGQLGDVNLIHSNADEMLTMASGAFKHRFGGRFNAAMWFWETADLPKRSRAAFHIVDELWVASEYQRDVFGQYAQVPVHVIGLAADLPERREPDRATFGWGEHELVFLFAYDALSSYGRKNPRKAIDAFVSAFGPHFKDVRFVLKVSNLNKFPASQKEILGLAERYPAVSVIDDYLTREEVMDLMAAADVYVSLHAAEGFGLTLLEAMSVETPVICTGYSGNMDFTDDENSWLVSYDMMMTEERTGPYPEGSIWASPSLEDTVEIMRHVADNRSEIAAKAKRAHTDAVEAASPERYARRLDAHLRRVL